MRVTRLEYPSDGSLSRVIETVARDGATVLEFGTAAFPAGMRSPATGLHVRDADELAVIVEGSFETESGGETRIVRAGDVVVIPAGEANASRALEPSRVIYLMLSSAR